MKKWQCTVCGYIHEGDEPPEECPVCGADRSKFIEIVSEEPVETEMDQPESEDKKMDSKPEPPISRPRLNPIFDLMVKHHVHPISVHIPNGVLPASSSIVPIPVTDPNPKPFAISDTASERPFR